MIIDANEVVHDCEASSMEVVETNSDMNCMKDSILDSVANSDGFFKSQQVGEEDLTFLEKRDIAQDLLSRNVPLFLQRYWKYIKIEDIDYFKSFGDYEVSFYVAEIRKHNCSRPKKMLIRNRRYEALKIMVKEGKYFSDSEMEKRNPFLYHQLIGQYLTESERIAEYKKQHENDRFSHFLMGQFDRMEANCLFNEQKNEDNAASIEEQDSDSEAESELEDDEPQIPIITQQEQSMLRNEFTNIMYENFLAGKDRDFDYSTIDYNVEYDSIDQRTLDEEEKYFDED